MRAADVASSHCVSSMTTTTVALPTETPVRGLEERKRRPTRAPRTVAEHERVESRPAVAETAQRLKHVARRPKGNRLLRLVARDVQAELPELPRHLVQEPALPGPGRSD